MCAGCGGNSDLPTTPGAWSSTNDSFNCNLGVFKFELGELDVGIDVVNEGVLCDGLDVDFENTSTPGYAYLWTFDDNTTSTEYEPTHTFPGPGTYSVILTVTDPTGCLAPVNTDILVNIESPPQPVIFPVDPVCVGEEIELIANGTTALTWMPNPLLNDLTATNHVIVPPVGTTQFSVTDVNVCGEGSATMDVVVQEVVAEITPSSTAICIGESASLVAFGAEDATWSPPLGLDNPNASEVEASPTETTTYSVVLTDDLGCTDEAEATVTVVQGPPGNEVYPSEEICQGFGVQLAGAEGDEWLWSPSEFTNDPSAQNPYVYPNQTTTFTVSILNLCGIGTDEVTVEVNVPEAFASGDGGVCQGDLFFAAAQGNDPNSTFSWVPSDLATDPGSSQTYLFPSFTTTYTVYVTDSDGCTASDDLTVYVTQPPPLTAGPDRRVALLDTVQLWGGSYGLDVFWTPSENLDCPTCLTPILTVTEPGWYVINAADTTGCVGRDSMFVDVFYPVYVPNSFTPDNDGLNDVFKAEGADLRGFSMRIFNRWGEVIFETDDPEVPWRGDVDGGAHYAPNGVYVWQVQLDQESGPLLLEGHVSLIR